jgi:quinol monooxygenase YgiN
MSVPTVKAHVSHVLEKLELNNRVQIALLAHDAGEAVKRRDHMVIVVARYAVGDGRESKVARLLRMNAEASRTEPGCLEFSVYQAIDDPQAFLLYERYTSEEAFQAHRRTPHFRDIIEQQVVPLLDERAWTRVLPVPA